MDLGKQRRWMSQVSTIIEDVGSGATVCRGMINRCALTLTPSRCPGGLSTSNFGLYYKIDPYFLGTVGHVQVRMFNAKKKFNLPAGGAGILCILLPRLLLGTSAPMQPFYPYMDFQ